MISVIIPFHNTERYLKRCIDSVLNSTYKDIEIILINDGSTDHSPEIAMKYCKRDPRIRLFNQKRKGVSVARNLGIEQSRGEWIVFVDSDDFISEDFLETVAEKKYEREELLIFNYEKWDSPSHKLLRRKLRKRSEEKSALEISYRGRADELNFIEKILRAQQLESSGKANLRSPCAKAYKKAMLDRYKIRFPEEISMGEDRLFNIEYQWKVQNALYIPRTVYFVQWRRESATHSFHPDYLQRDERLQKRQKQLLDRCGLLPMLNSAYYDSVLSNLSHVLIKGIFSPYSPRRFDSNCRLCERMQRNLWYGQALEYAHQSMDEMGILPRRVLLGFYAHRRYGIVNLICKLCYGILMRI